MRLTANSVRQVKCELIDRGLSKVRQLPFDKLKLLKAEVNGKHGKVNIGLCFHTFIDNGNNTQIAESQK